MSTPVQRRALERYCARIQRIFGLEHWTLTVSASAEDRSEAGTFIVNNADVAELYVPERFWTHAPEEQRRTVAHELLHLHFDRALLDFYGAVEKIVPEWIVEGIEVTTTRVQERAIERFAVAISSNLPLPNLPSGSPPPKDPLPKEGADVVGSTS